MVSYLKKKSLQDVVIVSPDHGGTTRARKFALNFGAPIAIIDKRRPQPNVAEVMNIIGDVKGKTCILVDDIVDTAGSASVASRALKKAGAKEVYLVATHPVLSGKAVERICASPITEFITTNSIKLPEHKICDKITQLSVAKVLGQGVLNIIDDKSVSVLFQYDPNQDY